MFPTSPKDTQSKPSMKRSETLSQIAFTTLLFLSGSGIIYRASSNSEMTRRKKTRKDQLMETPIPFVQKMRLKSKVSREINKLVERELNRILYNFSWEKVEMTPREKTSITESEFLQL